jgi:hypothetical protein
MGEIEEKRESLEGGGDGEGEREIKYKKLTNLQSEGSQSLPQTHIPEQQTISHIFNQKKFIIKLN